MVHFWICTSLSPNSTGSENILIDKCSSTLFSYFIVILLLLLISEIKLSFDTLDLVKKCHISLQQQLLLKKLLAITRKIAGAWKSKIPQKLATPTIIKKTGAQLKVVIFKIWSSWIRIRMATLTQLMTWILYVHISKIGTFSIKKF